MQVGIICLRDKDGNFIKEIPIKKDVPFDSAKFDKSLVSLLVDYLKKEK